MAVDLTNDGALRKRVANLIDDGQLPFMLSRDIAASYGSGVNNCAACGRPIDEQQIEYSVEINKSKSLHFHMRCHTIWQIECDERRQRGGS